MASASENFLKQAFKISQIPGPKKNVASKKFTSQKFTIKSSQTRSLQAVFEFLLSIFTSFDVTLVIRISHFFKQARSSNWSMRSFQEMFLKCLGHKARSLPVISFQIFNNDSKKLFSHSEQEVCFQVKCVHTCRHFLRSKSTAKFSSKPKVPKYHDKGENIKQKRAVVNDEKLEVPSTCANVMWRS